MHFEVFIPGKAFNFIAWLFSSQQQALEFFWFFRRWTVFCVYFSFAAFDCWEKMLKEKLGKSFTCERFCECVGMTRKVLMRIKFCWQNNHKKIWDNIFQLDGNFNFFPRAFFQLVLLLCYFVFSFCNDFFAEFGFIKI